MSWTISNMVRNADGTQKDGVTEITANYTMTEGEHSVSYPIFAKFDPDKSKEGYVAWADLTKEIVETWLDQYVNIENIKADLTAQIAEVKGKLVAMPGSTEGLPWE